MFAVSTRSQDSRMIALRQANEVRSARAKLKRDLRDGTVRLDQILADQPKCVTTASVFDLLLALPKIGPVRAARLLGQVRVSQTKTVGALTDRQRNCLIELLRRD